jgi:hypothetical protein
MVQFVERHDKMHPTVAKEGSLVVRCIVRIQKMYLHLTVNDPRACYVIYPLVYVAQPKLLNSNIHKPLSQNVGSRTPFTCILHSPSSSG